MKLKGREKFFWERNFNVKSLAAIPSSIDGIVGIDSDHDDEFFFYLASRVHSVDEIRLRCTNVTDAGVRHIAKFASLRILMLKDHYQVTKESLSEIDKLINLEYLDISKNSFSIRDLYALTHLKKLKELLISSELTATETEAELLKLQEHFPGCEISVY